MLSSKNKTSIPAGRDILKIKPIILYLFLILIAFTTSCANRIAIIENSGTDIDEIHSESEYLYASYLYPIKDLEPLPDGLIDEINSIYKGFTSFSCLNVGVENSDRYLGIINGYYIFFNTVEGSDGFATTSFKTERIGGYEFTYYEGFDLCAYKEGSLIGVKELYDSGLLSAEHLHNIYSRNYMYIKYFDPDSYIIYKTAISEDDLININKAWSERFGENQIYAHSIADTYKERQYCYGKINDVIVFKHPIEDNQDTLTQFTIDGMVFRSDRPFQIWVYVEDDLITLSEAYDRGVLTLEEIRGLSYMNEIINY